MHTPHKYIDPSSDEEDGCESKAKEETRENKYKRLLAEPDSDDDAPVTVKESGGGEESGGGDESGEESDSSHASQDSGLSLKPLNPKP